MPFQSEKQRRYLWANEPEIARDWSDTYGHRAQGYDGGVMRVPFQLGGDFPYARQQMTMPQNYSNLPFQGARTIDRYKDVDPYRMNYLNRDLPNTYLSQSMLPGSKWSMEQNAARMKPDALNVMSQGFQNQQDQGLAWHGQPTLQKMFQAEDFPLRGNIEKTKQGLGELWQGGTDIAQDVWKKGKEYGIQGKDLLMAGLGAVTGVPLGLMNLMRKGIRPDTEYETYQKQMMGVPTTGQQAGKDPWGKNIRSLKGGYDVEDQWNELAGSKLGQKYNLAEIGKDGITKEEEDWLREQGLNKWQIDRAKGLSKYGGKAAAWKKKRQVAGQKQEKDRYKRVQEAEAAQKQRAAQAAMAAQQAASVEQAYQHQTGAGSGYSGGERTDPHGITSYHDPFDPGGGE